MTNWTYFFINFGAVVIPFIYSFHRKLQFTVKWKSAFLAITITLVPFILWDAYFTSIGVWSFNEKYTLNFSILALPIEEWLFFITIPYATLFTYHCLEKLLPITENRKYAKLISSVIILTCLIPIFFYNDRLYTTVTAALLVVELLYVTFFLKANWLFSFFRTYGIILIPFFIVNGLLTGWLLNEPVVQYNDGENLGIRLNTIPIEDAFYGLLLLLTNTILYESFQKK